MKQSNPIHLLTCPSFLLRRKSKSSSVIEAEKAIPLRYAENLSLSATEDYTIARLRNPWDTTRILHTYVLVDKKKSCLPTCRKGHLSARH